MRNHAIENEHPEFVSNREMWRRYSDLYAGGERLRKHANQYLIQRHKEPAEVYYERLNRVFYENYVGSIIDWFAATLLRREPVVQFTGDDPAGKAFFGDFMQNCDRKGTPLADFFRQQITDTLIYGSSYAVVDFPRVTAPAANRYEEEAAGVSRAYLTAYSADQVTNWGKTTEGDFEWVVLKTDSTHQPSPGATPIHETVWTYYDRENYEIYRRQGQSDSGGEIVLADAGPHALALEHRVPIFELKTSEGLWLMNKAALLQLEHFNKSNALAWALTMGLFASPVVYSNKAWNQIIGESYYIQLGQDDRFGWTEPEGRVYSLAADNLDRLKDEIYRVCYLLSQAGKSDSGGLPQSGLSKQMDFSITQEILRVYGDIVKTGLRKVLQAIVLARKDELSIDVSGLDEFDIGDFSVELDNARNLLAMGIGSKTLKQEMFKRLAFKYLSDARQDLKNQIAAEIDASLLGATQE
ncbi:MAG TPA: hypothetical protein VGL72_19315 [Bryobacteraceae bacterium]